MQTLLRELPWKPLDPSVIEPLAAAIRTLCVSPMLPSGEAAFAAAAHLVVALIPRVNSEHRDTSDSCCFQPTLYALGSQVEGLDALAVPDSHGGDERTQEHSIAHCTLATAAGLFCAQQPDLSIASGLLPPLMRLATSHTGEEERLLSVCLACLSS
jgi:hypothetical protein